MENLDNSLFNMTATAQKFALYTSLDGSVRNRNAAPSPELRTYARRQLSALQKAEIADTVERLLAEAEEARRQKQRDAKKRELLKQAEAESDSRERRGLTRRKPTGYGTPEYHRLMREHRALKAKQAAEAEARRERRKGPQLSDAQRAAVKRQLSIARGAPLSFEGNPI